MHSMDIVIFGYIFMDKDVAFVGVNRECKIINEELIAQSCTVYPDIT